MASTFPFSFDGRDGGGGGGNSQESPEASGASGGLFTTSSNCDVCHRILKSLNDVKTLRCLHNFCLSCTPAQGIQCPLCSGTSVFSAPANGRSRQYPTPTSGFLPEQPLNPLSIDTSFLVENLIGTANLRRGVSADTQVCSFRDLPSTLFLSVVVFCAFFNFLPYSNRRWLFANEG